MAPELAEPKAATADYRATIRYRWVILALTVITATAVAAAPVMALPVLFDEISDDLGLSLVQVGLIWGMSSFTAIFVVLAGGVIGDRFGTRSTLALACLLTGLTGAMRGLSIDFVTLLVATFLFGFVQPMISLNLHKVCAVWFPNRELGMANGAVSTGMALGFLLGSLLSAAVLSPALGGWRRVLYAYGGLAIVIGLLWFLTRAPDPAAAPGPSQPVSIRRGWAQVTRQRNVWIMGLAALGFGGGVQGALGYLPLYLRTVGWSPVRADTALATFHAVSLCATIPIALLSDRLGKRRELLMLAAFLLAVGTGMLSVVEGVLVWAAVILAGLMRDGFMAVFMTTVQEIKGVGPLFAGTGMGFTLMFLRLGGAVSPPAGNSLASLSPGAPFLLWSALAFLGFMAFVFLDTADLREG